MEVKVNLKIFIFILLFYLTGQLEIYGLLMAFAFLHELGHFMMGIILKFKPKALRIMPFGLTISFSVFPKDYNRKVKNANQLTIKKMIIAIAGPITNLFLILFLLFQKETFLGINRNMMIYANFLIAIFNLIPIYPLDGGRIIKYIISLQKGREKANYFSNEIANITIILLTMLSSIAILFYHNIAIILVLGYLWFLVILQNKRYREKRKLYRLIKNNT